MTTYAMVAVPEHLLGTVYGLLLADLDRNGSQVDEREEAIPVRNNGSWTKAELTELSRRLTHPGGLAVMDVIAKAGIAGESVYYEDLHAAGAAAMSGEFTFDQLRSQLSWISRYSKAIRGGVKQWPLDVSDRGPAHERGQRYEYTTPKTIGEWWLELRGAR